MQYLAKNVYKLEIFIFITIKNYKLKLTTMTSRIFTETRRSLTANYPKNIYFCPGIEHLG